MAQTIASTALTEYVANIFHAAGASHTNAKRVAESLVLSNLVGHNSHGVMRVPAYLSSIAKDDVDPAAQPVITSESGAITQVDAQHGFGQVAASFAMQVTIEKAQTHGLAATTLLNSGHVGRLGEWPMMAVEKQMIGLAFCNGSSPGGLVTPYGGVERKLGTNPIAAAVPVAGRSPILLDFATSVVAEGKVRLARIAGGTVPEGWIINEDGQPSTNPGDLYDGGMLLPAGAHKGYSLAVLVEILGGILTGMGAPAIPDYTQFRNGVLFIVFNIERFRPLADFLTDTKILSEQIKDSASAPGFDEVLLPGELEQIAIRSQKDGISLDEATWRQLTDAAQEFGVTVPSDWR